MNQQKLKNQIKMKTKNYEVNYCKMCRNGYRISRRIWWTRMFNHINTPPALLVNYLLRREQMWYLVSTAFLLASRRTEIVTSALGPRGLLAEDAQVQSCLFRKFLVIVRTGDHKVPSEGCESRNNHRYAVVVQELTTQWIQSYPRKTKTSQETHKSFKSSWSRRGNQK